MTLKEIDLKLISEKFLLKKVKYKNKINIEKKIILIKDLIWVSLKNIFFDIYQVFMDKFCIKAPINNGTQYLITRIRYMSNIGGKHWEHT